jgi:predicted metal-dependent HD superfamily phosphohydrolase
MQLTTDILRETALYIKKYFDENASEKLRFHNYEHTVNIVRYCDSIGLNMDLKKQDQMALHISAWFMETGYCSNPCAHEAASIELAKTFLKVREIDDEIIRLIEETILSTRKPQQPVSLIGQVLCDAGMYYLSNKNYLSHIENLRTEYKDLHNKTFTDNEWLSENLRLFENHFYFTSSARKLFDKDKEKIRQQLQSHYEVASKFQKGINNPYTALPDLKDIPAYPEDDIKLERGVETLFRITARRHMELTNMAHDKANLIISINAIIISVILSVLVVKLDENTYLVLPTLFLVLTSVITILIAILSTRPRIIQDANNFDKHHDQVHAHEKNILFFGHFSKMTLEEFEIAMKETYKNREQLYQSLSKDIYYQGLILVWKYKYITMSYNVFIIGFIISILAFILAFILHTPAY